MRFEQQVALVTGAASGIGRALVQRLVAEGAAVVAVDIVEAPLQALVADLQEQGATITGCSANVASDTDVASMLSTATSSYGRLDILCNNAGIMDLMTPAAEVSLDLQDRDHRCRCCRSHDRRVVTTARIWGNDQDGACGEHPSL